MQRSRLLARALTPMAAVAGALVLAGPAFAHVEVEAANPQALAVDAVIAFNAEGESDTAGITEVAVALPSGIAFGDITLVAGPTGWTLKPFDSGYALSGPALGPGESAKYTIKVRQLPDAKELAFKSLVTYSDHHVDRWIELPQGGSKPEHPAPVLKLTAAAPGATPLAAPSTSAAASAPASPSTAPATATPAAASTAPSAPAAAPAEKKSSSGGTVVIAVVAAAAVLTGILVWRRRSAR